ncbi:MAG: 30S ribosomal protein S8 [Candidatus Marinimicrobia bacterium]|nr:30S ribosomal protein S8 [Candidatus Neomarinimicrobiota bacterium]
MSHTYPIADYLTRIRNAQMAKKRWVDIPTSNMKKAISLILRKEGYIKDIVAIDDGVQGRLRLFLKYMNDGRGVIYGIECISKPGRRIYCTAKNIPRVKNGYGISIISTSSGIMSGREAKKQNQGGEVICRVW